VEKALRVMPRKGEGVLLLCRVMWEVPLHSLFCVTSERYSWMIPLGTALPRPSWLAHIERIEPKTRQLERGPCRIRFSKVHNTSSLALLVRLSSP
jgi:hypothetical protein